MTNRPEFFSYGANDTISSRQQALVNNQFSSDVTFLVGPEKKRIYGHKMFLTVASQYFYLMFYGSLNNPDNNEYIVEGVEPDVFEEVLRYMYSKTVALTLDNVRNIFDFSKKCQLTELLQTIEKFLRNEINRATTLRIFQDNAHYGYSAIDQACLNNIRKNTSCYLNNEDFTNINMDRLNKILHMNEINCTTEQLQKALETWHAANSDSDFNLFEIR
ncbi:BTB/POZ domain-containing protein 3-like [Anopheles nili]|uniref:BTB/POZ domain-containing protein 3-like n=1 Tax=Anopheles nili TaxID=185578 RepID=UPI00237BCE6D|nr:BTB/POZ domain-containing protein 3-like [Anopheles nili]